MSSLLALIIVPALLIASATFFTVATLSASPLVTVTLPRFAFTALPIFASVVAFTNSPFATSTVIVRVLPSVLPDTTATPVPTNLTSFAFFTCSVYSCFKLSVVLFDETTQPIPRKSPTVAAVSFATPLSARLVKPE